MIKCLEKSFKLNWNQRAFSDYQADTITYSRAAIQILRLHLIFGEAGIQKGDKIALIGKNSKNWAIIYLAVISYGAVIVPILPDFGKDDVHHIVNHSGSLLLFVGEEIVNRLDPEEMKSLKGIFRIQDLKILEDRTGNGLPDGSSGRLDRKFEEKYGRGFGPDDLNFQETGNGELAEISYTSGTTGYSKGVMLQYDSLMANIIFAQDNMPLLPGDKIVSFLPLAHSYGCAFEFLFPVTLGCHIVFLTKTPSPRIITRAFRDIRPRLILSVPLVIEKIYKKQILPVTRKPVIRALLAMPGINRLLYGKIRRKMNAVFGGNFHEIVIGGAALSQEAEDFFRKIGLPITVGYGMTECGPLISYSSWKTTKPRSAGRPVNTLEVRIDSRDAFREPGEIMVRGENVMAGYYKNEKATREVLDDEGWLKTGDLGVTDEDGFIFIRGRSKSMILGPSGQNIYPEEVEARINNLEFVAESVVVEREGKLVALIFPDQDAMEKKGISPDDLPAILEKHRRDLNKQTPSFINVAGFDIRQEEFVKTPKKSIKRYLYQ